MQAYRVLISVIFFIWILLSPPGSVVQAEETSAYKVLVVMSYDTDYPWEQEIQEGIESVLGKTCEIKYAYLQTKKVPEQGLEKAGEAYELFQEFQPDGVIAADDNAQTMFVIPYLKNKVQTPVMFCGVNAEPEDYGYPASNVSGILEIAHLRESFAFAQQLVPSIRTSCYMVKKGATAQGFWQQVEREKATYPTESVAFKMPGTLDEALTMAEELRENCDVLFLESLQGIPDQDGVPRSDKDVLPLLIERFGKATVGGNLYLVEYGTLCAIIKMGQEQGATAAAMLLQAMQGTPIADLPITRNTKGRAVLNVSTMRDLGITPKPYILQDVQFVQTIR